MDADTRDTVWDMRQTRTEHAGGAQKNRVFDGTVTLDAGDYIAYYLTDDSHAFGDWNAAPPVGGEYWGLTLLTENGKGRIRTFAERENPNAIAQITASATASASGSALRSTALPRFASTPSARATTATCSTTAGSRAPRPGGPSGR